MTNLAVYLCILAMASWAVSGQDTNEMLAEFSSAEKVEVSATLSSDTEGAIVGQDAAVDEESLKSLRDHEESLKSLHEESLKSLTEIAGSPLMKTELSVLQLNQTIKPEIGEKLPGFVQSFPGCSCSYEEGKGKWKCAGTIAYPAAVSGDKCCCCGLTCDKRQRCNNEQCLTIGIDQGPEVAAEQAAWDKLMKGADILIGDDLPGFFVDLGKGQCKRSTIIAKCKEKGLTPLCDHTSYSTQNQCYTPRSGPSHNRHFSHWGGHRVHMNLGDDYMFYGTCFYALNGDWALAPCNGDSHCWTNGNSRLSPNARVLATGDVPNIYFNDLNACKAKPEGLGCWRTVCVKMEPNKAR